MQITRYILPVVVGSMVAMMLIMLGETGIIKMYPLPPGINQSDSEAIAQALAKMPLSAFIFLLVNYAVCSFLAGVIATLIAKRVTIRPAIVIGIILTISGLYNVVSIKHPMWFSILNLFIYLPFVYFGYLVVRIKEPVY